MDTIGKRIKFLREQNHLTQQQLGDIVGLHNSNIGRIENNKVYPTADVLIKIIKHFQISGDWLLLGQNSPPQVCKNAEDGTYLNLYRQLSPESQKEIINFMEFLLYKTPQSNHT